jgi:hypothetical protein
MSTRKKTKTKTRASWPEPESPFAADQAKAPRKTAADLEAIKIEAVAEIVHRIKCIQGEIDPAELEGTNGDEAGYDPLSMLGQHGSDLSEAWFVWEAACRAQRELEAEAEAKAKPKTKAKRTSAEIGAIA